LVLPIRFHRVPEIGERRVEQLLATAERVVARTRDALFELEAGTAESRFRSLTLGSETPPVRAGSPDPALRGARGRRPLGAARGGPGADGGREAPGGEPAVSGCARERALQRFAGDLHYAGKGGLFRRDTGTGAWMPLRPGPVRAIATGNARFPYLVESQGALALLSLPVAPASPAREPGCPIDLPYPARETLSALVTGDRLLLGSSGFGIWQALLPALPAPAPVAQVPGEAQRSAESDARIRK
jgi:hypothetical protein